MNGNTSSYVLCVFGCLKSSFLGGFGEDGGRLKVEVWKVNGVGRGRDGVTIYCIYIYIIIVMFANIA